MKKHGASFYEIPVAASYDVWLMQYDEGNQHSVGRAWRQALRVALVSMLHVFPNPMVNLSLISHERDDIMLAWYRKGAPSLGRCRLPPARVFQAAIYQTSENGTMSPLSKPLKPGPSRGPG